MSDIPDSEKQKKKQTKKMPKSLPEKDIEKKDEVKKLTTKEMVYQALTDLKNRKGTSLQAIKKYIRENYSVDVVRNNYIINKTIKNGLEVGTVTQTSGTGASGSFKLIPVKKNSEKKAPKKDTSKKTKDNENKDTKGKESEIEATKKKTVKEKVKSTDKVNEVNSTKKEEIKTKKSNTKKAKVAKTPAKKRLTMLRRKSIGSIIKPPRMKPKATA